MYRKLSMAVDKLAFQAGWAWRTSIVSRQFAAFAPEDQILPVPISRPLLRKGRATH